ncbi:MULTISPECIES: putative quinol monooxygenase [Microbacterium]|uniref:putative quinol monooxygenase n=1 Tax=Microbacterium TaxID=33882 RepID=UPI002789DA50|nr:MULTISPECIES: putative quinol monooxygenase [Microbacterium]MDQ1084768.1 quinol monooxygenase YgiN [Microbacterium sp. SORGH_AS_0344]MDQ1169953.1 quinol monooxygenase YgiN [Microbacterium proteolyticum]
MSAKYLYAEFRAQPGHADALAALVAGYGSDVSGESGNLRFDAHRVSEDRDRFFVYEQYVDEAAFQAHLATPHCAAFNEAIAPLVAGGGSTLTWLDPVTP